MADDASNQPAQTLLVKVSGMHCPNCEVLVERRFGKVSRRSDGQDRLCARQSRNPAHGDASISIACRAPLADEDYKVSAWTEQSRQKRPAIGIRAATMPRSARPS